MSGASRAERLSMSAIPTQPLPVPGLILALSAFALMLAYAVVGA